MGIECVICNRNHFVLSDDGVSVDDMEGDLLSDQVFDSN